MFSIETVKRVCFFGPPDDDELLGITIETEDRTGEIMVYASFDNYPSPNPLLVDLKLDQPEWLIEWYHSEVAKARERLDESGRAHIDSLPYNPYRLCCRTNEHSGTRFPGFSFWVDSRDGEILEVAPSQVSNVRSATRSEP